MRRPDQALSIATLEEPGGGTALFAQTAGFMAAFLIAVLVAAVASEFTRGTFRTMLLQQPARGSGCSPARSSALVGVHGRRRRRSAEVLSWVTSRLMAPARASTRRAWLTVDGIVAGLEDFGRASLFLAGTAVFATMVGVLARSVPIGVGAALVWLGPVENIIGDSWDPGAALVPRPAAAGRRQPRLDRRVDRPGARHAGRVHGGRHRRHGHRPPPPRRHVLTVAGAVRRVRGR